MQFVLSIRMAGLITKSLQLQAQVTLVSLGVTRLGGGRGGGGSARSRVCVSFCIEMGGGASVCQFR